ncbi:MmgE/PrpD family protein [Phaeobacter marinintestinus]|uniref:MmgE/PrpD family protein n=1 Tax=Falsiphaeobacter marinintestinus TaxID=1492905 RepID=UPI0011B7D834|nr:MmgE/PrpD family protein [Phaeobacter marinintestinus]
MTPYELIHDLHWSDCPAPVQTRAELCILDLIGVAAGAMGTDLSAIIRDHAVETFGGTVPILFDGRTASAPGAALAGAMTIDALDGHDGFNAAKGHVGCALLPAVLAFAEQTGADGSEFLATIVMGYEFGSRLSVAQHATTPDYHTSGSWGAVVAAAAGARLLRLDHQRTREALGIAEYHGPRSQMMRCIDHPTMVKDGSGWGAMAGVSAAQLARRGFTGAPAITVESTPTFWTDLGTNWLILDQYFKPYPVCRWAHGPIDGVLKLARDHNVSAAQVARIEVTTFHESVRLATRRPRNTEEAQYSTSFPSAVAMVRGDVGPAGITGDALSDPEILRLSDNLVMQESDSANAAFPATRLSRVDLVQTDGTVLKGEYLQPRWDPVAPPTEAELRAKFHGLADPVLGADRADAIEAALADLANTGLRPLTDLLYQPIN